MQGVEGDEPEPDEPEPIDAEGLTIWRDALGRVLVGRDLEIVTQPIVALRAGSVVGYEALARFAGSPPAAPEAWFRMAAEFGVAPELLATTLRRQLALAEHVPRNCLLAAKVSCLGLDAESVQAVLDQAPLDRVVFVMDGLERFGDGDDPGHLVDLGELIGDLRGRGARIALTIDGRTDLAAVLALAPDIVRVDRRVIDGIERDEATFAAAEDLHAQLEPDGVQLLAHGIETAGELGTLVGLGVPLGQGYLLGRPAPGWARPARPGPPTRPDAPDGRFAHAGGDGDRRADRRALR